MTVDTSTVSPEEAARAIREFESGDAR